MKTTKIDLHNHTTLCNHAEGTIDTYIQKAIALGIDIYGFTEHAPMYFDEKYRPSFSQMALYEEEVRHAKEHYADQIEILVGYEVDWLVGYVDERVLTADVDLLVGSVHFINQWGFDNPEFLNGWQNRDVDDIWQAYFESVEAMAKSGYFDVAGHLDLIKVFNYLPKQDIRLLAKPALKAIKEANMVLEINTAGLRKPIQELYPSVPLLQEAYALDIPITFGSDAHRPTDVGAGLDEAYRIAKQVGYTHAVTFRNRQRKLVKF